MGKLRQRQPALFLIQGGLGRANSDSADVQPVSSAALTARELRSEAQELEAFVGSNPYSEFIFKHGRRPEPGQTASMGRLYGLRLKASDGSVQPPRTSAEHEGASSSRKRRKDAARRHMQILRLKQAISCLSENQDEPAEILDYINPSMDEPIITAQLEDALYWLNQFAQEWKSRGKSSDGTTKSSQRSSARTQQQ